MKTKLAFLLLGLSLASPSLETIAATLDQQYLATMATTGDGLVISKSQTVAQTFQVGMSGLLERVELGLARYAVLPTNGLTFEVRSTLANGSPGSSVLASVPIAAADVSTSYQFLNIDLRPFNLAVTSGDTLALLLSCESPVVNPGGDPFVWSADGFGGYTSGAAYFWWGSGFSFASTWDVAFRTYVDTATVPEPSIFGLSLVGGILIFRMKRLA